MAFEMDDFFAEIDIEPAKKFMPQSNVLQKDEVLRSKVMHPAWANQPVRAPAAQPIAPRTPDPVRERFFEMRRLSAKTPYPRNTSELFYRQARFMEDFEDSFEGNAGFNMYFPCYQQMGYDYLRTYFTWRTKVRAGIMENTSLSYIFLYIYELLSGIGVKDPAEGLEKLIDIWDVFSAKYDAIGNNLSKWFKDYHIFYDTGQGFAEFAEKKDMKKRHPLTFMLSGNDSGQLLLWNSISGYDITNSKFYRDGNEELLENCFDAVINAIREFCNQKGSGLEDMLVYSSGRRSPWRPFKNALFFSRAPQKDREIHISKYEHYYCKNGQWTANLPIYYSSQKDFIGYIIKKTEACLRNAAGYKYKLAAEMKPGAKPFRELQRTAANRVQLDKVISCAVEDFYKNINRIVVAVDHSSLERIREEALETQEQLIVEEETDETLRGEISQPSAGSPAGPVTLSFADGWKELGKILTGEEKETLLLAIRGGDVKAYALEMNIMPEVLLDGINGKASDCIGDSIMEYDGAVYIYDEYKDNIAEILKNMQNKLE